MKQFLFFVFETKCFVKYVFSKYFLSGEFFFMYMYNLSKTKQNKHKSLNFNFFDFTTK